MLFRKLPPQAIRNAYNNDHAATCVLLCTNWLRDNPNDLSVIHDYATMLYKMTRFDEAMSVYDDALARFPDSRWGIYNQIGHLHRYRGLFPEAAHVYRQAVECNPHDATSYIFLSAVQARQEKLIEAEKSHRLATHCQEGFIDEAYHNLGLVLRGQGRLAEAKECFEKAIQIDNDYANALEALKDVTTALEIDAG